MRYRHCRVFKMLNVEFQVEGETVSFHKSIRQFKSIAVSAVG